MKPTIITAPRHPLPKSVFAAAAALLIVAPATAGEGESSGSKGGGMTLPQAIIRALSFDPTIGQTFADVIQADGFAKSVRSDMRPHLSFEASAGGAYRDRVLGGANVGNDLLFSRTTSLVGRQLLWSNGYFSNRYKDAQERTQAKLMLDRDQRESTALATVHHFLDVVRGRAQVALSKVNVEEHRKVLELAKSRAQAAGNQADVELASARTKLAESLLRERELDVLLSESHFQRYVGIKPPALIPPKVPHFTSYANINLQNNWHYKAVEHQHAAAMLEEKTMRAKSGPRVYLEGRGDVGNNVDGIQGRNNGASLMVTASWSIFDGGQRKADIQQANADVQRQQAILDETLTILQHDSQSRWDDYRTRSEHISILKKYHENLVKTIDLYRQQFELGTRPLLSILDIQSEATGAKIRIADEERDWADSGYHLLYFSGQLIPRTVGEGYTSTPRAVDGSATSKQLP